jgi:hypothetical protein
MLPSVDSPASKGRRRPSKHFGPAIVIQRLVMFVLFAAVSHYALQRILEAGINAELDILQRAVRSVPGSGQVWARYIRCLVRWFFFSSDIYDLAT